MDKHIIEHTIPKSAEGSYYTLDFPVPPGLERVTVSYSYPRLAGRMVCIVDLGLADGNGRFLGWSGSARSVVSVGPNAATKGYLMTELAPGMWKIIIGAYKIPPGGLNVRYEITYTPAAPRWLCGDLHIHSDASDGKRDIFTLTRMALRAGLDFIAVANHNNFSENLSLPHVPGLALIPTVEWTHYKGHMNFFGVAAPFDNSFVANSEQDMLALVARARDKGALISANHPKCGLCPYLWQSETCFDMVEVWNGPMRGANLRAIDWWHGMVMAGRRIPLVGGSDYHKPLNITRFAQPVTWVFAQSPSAGGILEALRRGHAYVSAAKNGPRLELRCGRAIMGDTAPAESPLTLRASGLRPWDTLRLITGAGEAGSWRGNTHTQVTALPNWRFAYLTVTRRLLGRDMIRAISNPIYFEGESPIWSPSST